MTFEMQANAARLKDYNFHQAYGIQNCAFFCTILLALKLLICCFDVSNKLFQMLLEFGRKSVVVLCNVSSYADFVGFPMFTGKGKAQRACIFIFEGVVIAKAGIQTAQGLCKDAARDIIFDCARIGYPA